MAFKMKGSPMKRNFGVGSSPAKNYGDMSKYSKPGDAVQFGDKDEPMKSGDTATYMKSPVKHSGADYAKEVEKDLGKKPSYNYAKAHDDAYGPGHTKHGEQNPKKEKGLTMKSPVKMEEVTTEEVVTEKKVNPHPPKTFKHALWEATNNKSKEEMLKHMQTSQRHIEEGLVTNPKAISNMRKIISAQQNILFPGGGMGGFDFK